MIGATSGGSLPTVPEPLTLTITAAGGYRQSIPRRVRIVAK
jgi:hypothetical protein